MKNKFMNHKFAVVALFLFAFIIRFNNVSYIKEPISDEPMHVPSALNYTEKGYFGPDTWHHPPLKHLLLYCSIKVFGDNPYGWRMRNVIFGAATTAILYLITIEITETPLIAIFSSLLLALDPLHIMLSRTTFEDIPAIFFITAGILFFMRHIKKENEKMLFLSGLFLGLGIACKIYGIFILITFIGIIFIMRFKKPPEFTESFVYLVITPLTVYLLTYYPWFQRGYNIFEWIDMQFDALREMATATGFHPLLMKLAGPEKWFISFLRLKFYSETADGWTRSVYMMNNIPVWILTIPSIPYLFISGIKTKKLTVLLIPVFFIVLYLPFLLVRRPILLYSASILLPFAFIAISYTAQMVFRRTGKIILIILLIESLILYPYVSGIKI